MFFHQSVVRLRAPEATDKYRNRTRDWTKAERTTLLGLSVQPAGRAEDAQPGERDRVTSGWNIQSPPGRDLDLLPTDRVELEGGVECEVVGEVARHQDPFGRGLHHVELFVQRVTG